MTIQIKVVQRVLGILLALFSTTMLTPVLVALIYGDGAMLPFIGGFITTFITGVVLFAPVRKQETQLKLRDGFVAPAQRLLLVWIACRIPFFFTDNKCSGLAVWESSCWP